MELNVDFRNGVRNFIFSAGWFAVSRMAEGLETKVGLVASGLSLSYFNISLLPLHQLFEQRNANHQLASKCLLCFQKTVQITACTYVFVELLRGCPQKNVSVFNIPAVI